MKDFTTSQYITPILNEIKKRYLIRTDETSRDYFKCVLLLSDPVTRQCYPVAPEKELYIPHLLSYRAACKEINDFCNVAETYPGELDAWGSREKDRIFLAVRDALINDVLSL